MRVKVFGVLALAALGVFTNVTVSRATLFYAEEFNYPNGNIIGNSNWAVHSGDGGTDALVSSGALVLAQGSSGREDVNKPTGFTMGAGDKWWAAFDLTVPSGATDVYFAHFMEGTTIFPSRLWTTAPNASGNFTLGLSSSSTLGAEWATDLSFNTAYRVVLSYDYDSGDSQLWVDPTTEASPSLSWNGTFSDEVTSFGFRQAGGSFVHVIDNFFVGTTFNDVLPVPEPASACLGVIGLVGLVGIARRRSAK